MLPVRQVALTNSNKKEDYEGIFPTLIIPFGKFGNLFEIWECRAKGLKEGKSEKVDNWRSLEQLFM